MRKIDYRFALSVGCFVAGFVFLVWLSSGIAMGRGTKRPFSPAPAFASTTTISPTVYLPVIYNSEKLQPSSEAMLEITPAGGLNASTFTSGSFILTNVPSDDQAIKQVTIDLRTAVFPDMVFDPAGVAGDQVAKDLSVDAGGVATGYLGRTYASPHDGGYDVLSLSFQSFDPGERFLFSIDVDPTSIRGTSAPGPYESGSVSGLELVGATVTVTFANDVTHTGAVYQLAPGNPSGGMALVRDHLPPAPVVAVSGIPVLPAVVSQAEQMLQISGEGYRTYKILVVEGGLFTEGVPGNGFDIDPFEANSALLIGQYTVITDSNGKAELPIVLWRTHLNGGLNLISVVVENPFGHKSNTVTSVVLQLQN